MQSLLYSQISIIMAWLEGVSCDPKKFLRALRTILFTAPLFKIIFLRHWMRLADSLNTYDVSLGDVWHAILYIYNIQPHCVQYLSSIGSKVHRTYCDICLGSQLYLKCGHGHARFHQKHNSRHTWPPVSWSLETY